jgi:hypothetical protein
MAATTCEQTSCTVSDGGTDGGDTADLANVAGTAEIIAEKGGGGDSIDPIEGEWSWEDVFGGDCLPVRTEDEVRTINALRTEPSLLSSGGEIAWSTHTPSIFESTMEAWLRTLNRRYGHHVATLRDEMQAIVADLPRELDAMPRNTFEKQNRFLEGLDIAVRKLNTFVNQTTVPKTAFEGGQHIGVMGGTSAGCFEKPSVALALDHAMSLPRSSPAFEVDVDGDTDEFRSIAEFVHRRIRADSAAQWADAEAMAAVSVAAVRRIVNPAQAAAFSSTETTTQNISATRELYETAGLACDATTLPSVLEVSATTGASAEAAAATSTATLPSVTTFVTPAEDEENPPSWWGFHGTRASPPSSLALHPFGFDVSGSHHANYFGAATYLSRGPTYSFPVHAYAEPVTGVPDCRSPARFMVSMLLCRVARGESLKMSPSPIEQRRAHGWDRRFWHDDVFSKGFHSVITKVPCQSGSSTSNGGKLAVQSPVVAVRYPRQVYPSYVVTLAVSPKMLHECRIRPLFATTFNIPYTAPPQAPPYVHPPPQLIRAMSDSFNERRRRHANAMAAGRKKTPESRKRGAEGEGEGESQKDKRLRK